MFPHEGKVYHLLAQIAIKDLDYLGAVYNSMRALSCSYPSTSAETKEALINLFQEIRMKDIEESKIDSQRDTASRSGKSNSAQKQSAAGNR